MQHAFIITYNTTVNTDTIPTRSHISHHRVQDTRQGRAVEDSRFSGRGGFRVSRAMTDAGKGLARGGMDAACWDAGVAGVDVMLPWGRLRDRYLAGTCCMLVVAEVVSRVTARRPTSVVSCVLWHAHGGHGPRPRPGGARARGWGQGAGGCAAAEPGPVDRGRGSWDRAGIGPGATGL
jgi:hypothetical protein